MIDLHVHSTFSDGSLTPEELVEEARKIGLSALALTDHDSTDGVPRLLAACRGVAPAGPIGIAGVEISVDVARGTMHMLGYFVEPGSARLQAVLARIIEGRESRNREILEKLNSLGLGISWDDVIAQASGSVVGRPHFALALKEKGYVPSVPRAFDLYLRRGAPAYAERFRLSPEEGISAVIAAGGVPVLAHPFTLELDEAALRDCVKSLAVAGLAGMEIYYPEHSAKQVRQYLALAGEFGLIVTGGTDFHGAVLPRVRLGTGFGSLDMSDRVLDELLARAGRTRTSAM